MGWVRIVVLVALFGCGRIGFDPLGGDDTTPGDGLGDAPRTAKTYFVNSVGGAFADVHEIDLATGATTLLGSLDVTYGEINGLAALDDNTLIATSFSGNLVRITLAPFAHAVEASGLGALTGLEIAEDGTSLRGIGELVDLLQLLEPPSWTVTGGMIIGGSGTFDVVGGDLVQIGAGWLVWTNANGGTMPGLYTLDVNTRSTERVLPGEVAPPELVGLAFANEILYGISRSTNAIVEIDPRTGAITTSRPLPAIPNVEYGDLAVRR